MSTSFLYHAFSIRGYEYVRTDYEGGAVIFTVKHKPDELVCSHCGCRRVIKRGTILRRFRTVSIGFKAVFISLAVQRVFCQACHLVRQVKIGFCDPRRTYTKAFERYVLELSKVATIKDIAGHLGVSWGLIKDIQKRNLVKRYKAPKLGRLKQIAIDEISIGKGHRYMTIVLCLETGAVVFVGDGKGREALNPFFKRLARSKARIKAAAIDMSPAYIAAILENLPETTIVFDHFHVIKLYNDRLSDFRRKLYYDADALGKKVIKGTRWLLLKNPENLDEKRGEEQRLHEALALNQPLSAAYYMKEDLRQSWNHPRKETAKQHLIDWVWRAGRSGISMLQKMAKTIAVHSFGILNYYDYPISTGPLEGTNNKIKTMKRQAYGFRDKDFFKLKIMAIHEAKYALVG
jgi:transposase